MLLSQAHVIFTIVLIFILKQSLTEVYVEGKAIFKSRIGKENSCLQKCKRRNLNASSSDDEATNCNKNCSVERRTKATTPISSLNTSLGCGKKSMLRQPIGNITDVTVQFKERIDNDTKITLTANVTWNVSLINSSIYSDDDIWLGYNILWLKQSNMHCVYVDKNTTWKSIEIGKSPSDAEFRLFVLVVFYPPSLAEKRKKLINFVYPEPTPKSLPYLQKTTSQPTNNVTTQTEPNRKTPTDEPANRHYVTYAVAAGVCLGVVILSLFIILHVKKKKSTASIYSHEPLEFSHDTSIIFSSRDQDFITKKLIPFLEKENNFKCYVHYRDWEVGENIHTNIATAIYNCRKIIAVISKHFLKSRFCMSELDMALGRLHLHRDSSLIVINLGVPPERLPKSLRRRTFLDLTSVEETKSWEKRIVRQISTDGNGQQMSYSSSPVNSDHCQGNTEVSENAFSVEPEEEKDEERKEEKKRENHGLPQIEIDLDDNPDLFIQNEAVTNSGILDNLSKQSDNTNSNDEGLDCDASNDKCMSNNDFLSVSSTSTSSLSSSTNNSPNNSHFSSANNLENEGEKWARRFKMQMEVEARNYFKANQMTDAKYLEEDSVNNNANRIVLARLGRTVHSHVNDSAISSSDTNVGIPV